MKRNSFDLVFRKNRRRLRRSSRIKNKNWKFKLYLVANKPPNLQSDTSLELFDWLWLYGQKDNAGLLNYYKNQMPKNWLQNNNFWKYNQLAYSELIYSKEEEYWLNDYYKFFLLGQNCYNVMLRQQIAKKSLLFKDWFDLDLIWKRSKKLFLNLVYLVNSFELLFKRCRVWFRAFFLIKYKTRKHKRKIKKSFFSSYFFRRKFSWKFFYKKIFWKGLDIFRRKARFKKIYHVWSDNYLQSFFFFKFTNNLMYKGNRLTALIFILNSFSKIKRYLNINPFLSFFDWIFGLQIPFKIQVIKKSGVLYGLPFVLSLIQQKFQGIKSFKDVLHSFNTTILKDYYNFLSQKESFFHTWNKELYKIMFANLRFKRYRW